MESGSYALHQPSLSQAEQQGKAFETAVGCTGGDNAQIAQCLRNLSVSQVLQGQAQVTPAVGGFQPNTGTRVMPRSIQTALATGDFNHVPVIEGTNRNEWRLFVALAYDLGQGNPLQAADYRTAIESTLGVPASVAQQIENAYPLTDYASPDLALSALGTDAIFSCNALAEEMLLARGVPTYAYEFNDPNAPELFLPPVSFPYASAHASEIQYLFYLPQRKTLSSAQRQLSSAMVRYWTRFARSGNPNSPWGTSTFWPDLAAFGYISLTPPRPQRITPVEFSRTHHCRFWKQLSGQ